jgi:hypothetical protein
MVGARCVEDDSCNTYPDTAEAGDMEREIISQATCDNKLYVETDYDYQTRLDSTRTA